MAEAIRQSEADAVAKLLDLMPSREGLRQWAV
jgi:hypothetical protein